MDLSDDNGLIVNLLDSQRSLEAIRRSRRIPAVVLREFCTAMLGICRRRTAGRSANLPHHHLAIAGIDVEVLPARVLMGCKRRPRNLFRSKAVATSERHLQSPGAQVEVLSRCLTVIKSIARHRRNSTTAATPLARRPRADPKPRKLANNSDPINFVTMPIFYPPGQTDLKVQIFRSKEPAQSCDRELLLWKRGIRYASAKSSQNDQLLRCAERLYYRENLTA